jgi:hypothetical protein
MLRPLAAFFGGLPPDQPQEPFMSQALTSVLDNIAIWWGQLHGPTIAAVIQMVAAIIGFPVVIYQLVQLHKNLQGGTQDRLYAHYTEICKLFMQHPELRPYFYGRSEVDAKTVKREQVQECSDSSPPKVAFMCEAIFGLVEHAVLQKRNLPGDAWRNCWRPYTIERLEQSEAMERFFESNAHWYSHRMRKAMKSIQHRLDLKKARAGCKRQQATVDKVISAPPNQRPPIPRQVYG